MLRLLEALSPRMWLQEWLADPASCGEAGAAVARLHCAVVDCLASEAFHGAVDKLALLNGDVKKSELKGAYPAVMVRRDEAWLKQCCIILFLSPC